jgi:hypothetical protein
MLTNRLPSLISKRHKTEISEGSDGVVNAIDCSFGEIA